MDFTPTEEQRALQSAVRDLASSLTPKDTGSGAPAGPQPFDADAWGKFAEMGLLGLAFAEDKGGFGASSIEVTLAAVELGAARVTLPYADAMAAAAALDAANSPLLADVISGEKLVLTAFGESGATWSRAASATAAARDPPALSPTTASRPAPRASPCCRPCCPTVPTPWTPSGRI